MRDFSQRFRQNLNENGQKAAEKWGKDRVENALNYDSYQNKKSEDRIKEFREQ